MSKIILDDALRTKLNGLDEAMDVCDESGKTVGHFLPADVYRELLYAWAKWEFRDEEEERLAREDIQKNGGYSTAEAIAFVEELARRYREKK